MIKTRQDRGGVAALRPGSKLFEGVAARVHAPGDGLRYQHDGSTVTHEYRDEAELRRIVSQLPGKRVELEHGGPKVGVVTEARLDRGRAVVTMDLDPNGQAAIKSMRELSLDYLAAVDERGYQRGIEVRALALVPRGRCGTECRITSDSAARSDCATECACTKNDALVSEREAADRLREDLTRKWMQ